jgi:hypothetical protein
MMLLNMHVTFPRSLSPQLRSLVVPPPPLLPLVLLALVLSLVPPLVLRQHPVQDLEVQANAL